MANLDGMIERYDSRWDGEGRENRPRRSVPERLERQHTDEQYRQPEPSEHSCLLIDLRPMPHPCGIRPVGVVNQQDPIAGMNRGNRLIATDRTSS